MVYLTYKSISATFTINFYLSSPVHVVSLTGSHINAINEDGDNPGARPAVALTATTLETFCTFWIIRRPIYNSTARVY